MAEQPMYHAYSPTSDGYKTMPTTLPPAAPTAAHQHVSTAGLGNLDMAGITIVLLFAAYALRYRLRARWSRQGGTSS